MSSIHAQYITDKKGNKLSVILPLKVFNTMLEAVEELEDIRHYDESINDKEPSYSKKKAMAMINAARKKLRK